MNETQLRSIFRGIAALALCAPAVAVSCGGRVLPAGDPDAGTIAEAATPPPRREEPVDTVRTPDAGADDATAEAASDACVTPTPRMPDQCRMHVDLPCDGGAPTDCNSLCRAAIDGGMFLGCGPLSAGTVVCYLCNAGGRRPDGYLVEARDSGPVIASYFAQMAELEAVSVEAFRRLGDELAALGAPVTLRRRARRAARDEIRHARHMRRFARRTGARPTAPRAGDLPLRDLEAVARENAVEGCVRETFGAALAAYQAVYATDPGVRAAMTRIAVDEAAHAALAWAVDAWASNELDPEARARVRSARDKAVRALETEATASVPRALAAVGLPEAHNASAIVATLRERLWS